MTKKEKQIVQELEDKLWERVKYYDAELKELKSIKIEDLTLSQKNQLDSLEWLYVTARARWCAVNDLKYSLQKF